MRSTCDHRHPCCFEKPTKTRGLLLLAVVTLALAAVVWATPTAEALDSQEQAFLQLINSYRQQNGLQPLDISPTLTTVAGLHSEDMADNDYFSHTSLDGRSFVDRVRDAGYTYDTWLGENIAAGYPTAQDVFDGWRGSPSHNANMLRPEFKVIGIGRAYNASSYYGWYWTTDFGGYDDSGGGESTTTMPSATTRTVLATTTTVETVTTTSTSTLTQTSTQTVTTAASTSTVNVTTVTTTLPVTESASSTTYVTRLTTATTNFISTETRTVSMTESYTYTSLTTYSYVSTAVETTGSMTTEVQVSTLTAGVTGETSISTAEMKATETEISVETSTYTTTTLSFSTQNVTVTLTEPAAVTETVTVHQSAPRTLETSAEAVLPSGPSWHRGVLLLLTMTSFAAIAAAFAAHVFIVH